MHKSILFVVTLLSVSVGFSASAHAKYSLCNRTSYVLSAAIAYVESDRLATRGWWRLRPGECKIVLTEPTNPGRYFVYAEAIPGHKGSLRAWSGDTKLCVENAGFFNLRNQEVCKDDPARQRGFSVVDVKADAKGLYQTDFSEGQNYSVFSAEVAGVQRLLNDVGESKVRIDGSLGRNTQRDLAAYRRKNNLGEGAVIDDATIDKLINEANAKEAKLGFFFCNKADAAVWTAIGEPTDDDDAYRSKGWWRLAQGDCAKVVKGELTSDHYYVYGVIENVQGERRLAGGDKPLCTNPVKFEILNDTTCADLEYDQAAFRKVEIGGAPAATFEFTVDMFTQAPRPDDSADAASDGVN